MSKVNFNAARAEFVDTYSALLVPRGMPRSLARLFSYLMLCPQPVSLDAICEDLQIAKSSASVAARLLESAKLVRRHSQPGTKRVLYSLPDTPAAMLTEHSQSLGQMGKLLQQSAEEVAEGEAVERMQSMAEFYLAMQQEMDRTIEELSASHMEKRQGKTE